MIPASTHALTPSPAVVGLWTRVARLGTELTLPPDPDAWVDPDPAAPDPREQEYQRAARQARVAVEREAVAAGVELNDLLDGLGAAVDILLDDDWIEIVV